MTIFAVNYKRIDYVTTIRSRQYHVIQRGGGVQHLSVKQSHSHEWHKVSCSHATALRMSAIYGANGAGKSNLLKCISLLKSMVGAEKLGDLTLTDDLYFRLDEQGKTRPSELAIEFFANGRIFYYHIVFNRQEVVEEELMISQKNKDIPIFSRKDNDVNVRAEYLKPGDKVDFIEVFLDAMNRIIRPDMPALSFSVIITLRNCHWSRTLLTG